MPKRKPAPTDAEIDAAIERAKKGKGRQLALMIKAASVKDVTWAFDFEARYPAWELDPWAVIRRMLIGAARMKQTRDELNERLRKAGAEAVRKHKAERKAAEVTYGN